MESVRKAKARFSRYPELIIECKTEGAIYAKCVVKQDHITRDSCLKEFQNFKSCLLKAAGKLKTKL